MASTEVVCPFCHSTRVRRYAYGKKQFKDDTERAAYYKNRIDGGEESYPDSPVHHCDACGKDFKRMDGKEGPVRLG